MDLWLVMVELMSTKVNLLLSLLALFVDVVVVAAVIYGSPTPSRATATANLWSLFRQIIYLVLLRVCLSLISFAEGFRDAGTGR